MSTAQKKQSWRPLAKGPKANLNLLLLVSGAGAGLSPLAPGTVGAIAAWAAIAATPMLPSYVWLLAGLLTFVAGALAIDRAQATTGAADPGWVVIDEIAAFWLLYGALGGDVQSQALMFLLFRFFDIIKPPPARLIDKRWHNGWGVMADDVVAAAWAGLTLLLGRFWLLGG